VEDAGAALGYVPEDSVAQAACSFRDLKIIKKALLSVGGTTVRRPGEKMVLVRPINGCGYGQCCRFILL
jgi:hypothetical protein